MNRKVLSYLLLILIALQSVIAAADVHPFDDSELVPHSSEYANDAAELTPEHSTVSNTSEQDLAIDEIFHCHHHGCHCHVYLSDSLSTTDYLYKHPRHNAYQAIIPVAPSSSLYRPPIV